MDENGFKVEIIDQNINDFELSFKIIIIGDSGVGKSCLSIRGTKNIFDSMYAPTIGFEFISYFIKINGQIIKLEIWDTCGQEAYRSIVKGFFFNTSLAVIAYAIDDKKSFNSIEEWIRQCKQNSNPEIKFTLQYHFYFQLKLI